jgi:outer membrane immunogenic protein
MFKKVAVLSGVILACGLLAAAQEVKSEVTVSAIGVFTPQSSNNTLVHKATDTGGVLAGYRYSFSHWGAIEANYGWNRNSQQYFQLTQVGLVQDRVKVNTNQATADFVYRVPTYRHLRPYLLGGGGGLWFSPVQRNQAFSIATGLSPGLVRVPTRGTGTFVYGGGVDINLTTRSGYMPGVGLRLGYRGYAYKVPDFGFARLNVNSWTHTSQPEAGLTFRF